MSDDTPLIYIVSTEIDWHVPQWIARNLHAIGYRVAPSRVLDYPDRPAVEPMPADARCVIVVWPTQNGFFDRDRLEFQAREAARRKCLVQVYCGEARPTESHAGPPPIDFAKHDLKAFGPRWDRLLEQVRKHCGAPPSPKVDTRKVSVAVMGGVMAVAIGGGVTSLMQRGATEQAAEDGASPPLPPIVEPLDIRSVEPAQPTVPAPVEIDIRRDTAFGGPDGLEKDLGVEPPPPARSDISEDRDPPLDDVDRAPQGPEQ